MVCGSENGDFSSWLPRSHWIKSHNRHLVIKETHLAACDCKTNCRWPHLWSRQTHELSLYKGKYLRRLWE